MKENYLRLYKKNVSFIKNNNNKLKIFLLKIVYDDSVYYVYVKMINF